MERGLGFAGEDVPWGTRTLPRPCRVKCAAPPARPRPRAPQGATAPLRGGRSRRGVARGPCEGINHLSERSRYRHLSENIGVFRNSIFFAPKPWEISANTMLERSPDLPAGSERVPSTPREATPRKQPRYGPPTVGLHAFGLHVPLVFVHL